MRVPPVAENWRKPGDKTIPAKFDENAKFVRSQMSVSLFKETQPLKTGTRVLIRRDASR